MTPIRPPAGKKTAPVASALLCCAALLVAVAMTPLLAAEASWPMPDSEGASGQQFLPIVARQHLPRPLCTTDSPFGIQIAALHQVGESPPVHGSVTVSASTMGTNESAEPFATLAEALAESGTCWARVRFNWASMQPDPPPADYASWADYDEKLGLLAGTGVRFVAIVDDAPDWAADLSCDSIYTHRLDEFADYLTDLVSHYKEPPWGIHHWELRNEPDGTREERGQFGQGCAGFEGDLYAAMLAVAYPAIKAADPDATVLLGGLAHDRFVADGGPFYRYFADDVMAAGGNAYLDKLTIHYFPDFAAEWERWTPDDPPTCGTVDDGLGPPYAAWGIDVIAKTRHFLSRARVCHGLVKPLWITEMALQGRAGDEGSLTRQARYVIKGHARALAAGVEHITWYTLVSPPYEWTQHGLIYETDWSPKPAYFAYQTLTRELAGYEYYDSLEIPAVEGYRFRKQEGLETTVAWGAGTWTLAPAGSLRLVDRFGAVTTIEDGGPGDMDGAIDGEVRLQMTEDPVFVSILN